jgi:CheY-like chemotaxis protein
MSEMDGYQVLNKLAADPRTSGTSVIFMSPSLAQAELNLHSTIFAPVDSIHKFVNKKIFVEKIQKHFMLKSKYGFLSAITLKTVVATIKSLKECLPYTERGVLSLPIQLLLRTTLPKLEGLYFETLLERA